MNDRDDDAWFAAKRFGFGSGLPIRWQGWVLVIALIATVWVIAHRMHGAARWLTMVAAVLVFAAVCAAKTRGGWKWR